ncbi:hypothetical protein ACFZC5_24805 [Nocardia gamkensis]|jgi:hypothetical protein|uniref:hypothetical protein n=1 Tax=Nocardia gamkensis TaxID=352869 RepID=UPI0036E5E4CB
MRSILRRHIRTDQPSFGMPWEPQFWDIDRGRPQVLFRRFQAWIAASRRRRRTAWVLIALFVLFVFPGLVGAVSIAQTGTIAPGAAPNSATSWMNVKDSQGVNVSSYMLVIDHGGVFNLGNFALWMILTPMFALWLVTVTTGVWFPGQAMDFGWLNLISAPLRAMAQNLTVQIATPLMAATALAIGAFFVGYFIVRALYAKAVTQVVTMIVFAIAGVFFLANPLAEALSDHGLLVQGRDLGLSVAAGLNGQNNPNPRQLVATVQATNADNFVRLPLQVWNFGHVVDSNPSCRAAWSAGMTAGSEDRVKNGMRSCGDSAAYAAVDNPGPGQIGAGLLLLLCAVILLAFAAYLSFKIMWAVLDVIYYGFASIFGFAAGGYIYGPTQTFTVRCVVHGFIAAGKMAFFVIALGIYELLLGSLFRAANGQIMVVFVIGACVEVVAIVQVRRLSRNIDEANDWVTNRIGAAIHSGGSAQGAGGGAAMGMGLGMGNSGAANSLAPLAMLGAVSTINSSPVTAWMFGGRLNPLSPFSRVDHIDKRNKARGLSSRDLRNATHGAAYDRVSSADFARAGIMRSGARRNSERAAAFAAENVAHATGMMGSVQYALRMAGISWGRGQRATIARADIIRHADDEPLASKHLGRVVAAHKHFERDFHTNPGMMMARFHGLEASVDRYRGDYQGGVHISEELAQLGRDYIDNPHKQWIDALQAHAEGPVTGAAAARLQINGRDLNQTEADRLRSWISNEHALRVQAATNWVAENPNDFERIRVLRSEIDKAAQTDQWQAGRNITGAVSLPQPNPAQPLPAIPGRILNPLRNPRGR